MAILRTVAIAMAERGEPWTAWRANFGSRYELFSDTALFSLGAVLAVLYVSAGPPATLLVGLPLLLAHQGYRRHQEGGAEAAEIVAALEMKRGIAAGSLQFIVTLGSARAVWDIRAIVTASPRISQAGLDEGALAADLGIAAHLKHEAEYDPFVYARGRLAFEATAAKVNPVGMAYPLSVQLREAPAPEIHTLATKAKNLGMKGVICPHAGWVAPVNSAFTPTPELVTYNMRVREAFAAGVAAGTAAVPLDGRMIDVPVDEWAIVVLATAEACAARDAEKQAAMGRMQ